MPEYLRPGVYVEEVSSGARPIAAIGTSTAAFFGVAPADDAPERQATMVTSYSAFAATFVGVAETATPLVRAAAGFFLNGGSRLYVVHLGADADRVHPEHLEAIAAIDGISLVAAPGFADPETHETLIAACEARPEWFAILDGPEAIGPVADLTVPSEQGGLRPRDSAIGMAAFYVPWIIVTDPISKLTVAAPPSGHVAGLYAEVDARRGVHKAPANAVLRGALDVTVRLTGEDQAVLNPAGVNCIRRFADGIKVWGARTLAGPASEWRYVPVRRLATMIEQSIERGTRWVVFEPNDETLWKSVRRDVGAFLHALWRDGALAGSTPEQAYFVRCDRDTMTQADIDAGRVVIQIGVAASKPAEFIVLQVTQPMGG